LLAGILANGSVEKTPIASLVYLSFTIFASPFRVSSSGYPPKGVFYFSSLGYCCGMNKRLEKTILKKWHLKVFLCHSHADATVVHDLYTRLKNSGVDAWLDREKLLAGQNWEHEIRKAILKSDVVIACLSHGFNKQEGFRHEEVKIALEKADLIPEYETFIIPVRLEVCDMPESLRHLHRVDLFERGGYKKLICALQRYVEAR
jgi:hypothetical protein